MVRARGISRAHTHHHKRTKKMGVCGVPKTWNIIVRNNDENILT